MPHSIPPLDSTIQADPPYKRVVSTDDIPYAWALTLPTGQVPFAAAVTVYDHIYGTDVSSTVKVGSPSIGSIVGAACVVTQRLTAWTAGKLYRCQIVVSTSSGLDFTFVSFFDCII